ncbi:exostosin-2-like [Antedon mediterranea]|uniref:exostosin-2-like n=1 Tax=Antedon mediterranea TaxID=105859 RepID=UPI003AF8BF75
MITMRLRSKYQNFYIVLFTVILFGVIVTGFFQFWPHTQETERERRNLFTIPDLNSVPEVKILSTSQPAHKGDITCSHYECLDVYHCGKDANMISVYIYPVKKYIDENGIIITNTLSKEFHEVLTTIASSSFYTAEPERACLFIPSIDMLSQNTLRTHENGQVLAQLPRWNHGLNHLLFNILPGTVPDFNTSLDVPRGKAIVAGGGFSTWTYRSGFDVSIPVFNPEVSLILLPEVDIKADRKYLAISAQIGIHPDFRDELDDLANSHSDILILDRCESGNEDETDTSKMCKGNDQFRYPHVLQDATFCIILRRARLGQPALSDALKAGCIPVVVIDTYVMPFADVLDWTRASISIREEELERLPDILSLTSSTQIQLMRKQALFYWENYFKSMGQIALTTLQIINDRIFPYMKKSYASWNEPSKENTISPFFLPKMPPKAEGFTAVVLTYNRVESLFKIIREIAKTPSLSKILVVWNNQEMSPPAATTWPKISKPLKVVQTKENKLSNRFYPYDEIETECVLALDDDILMLNPDELEFGYEVWREFPDRLVGYPGRLHTWDEATGKWKYESEWTSSTSMVLSGAAFYHKYFNFLYTHRMPSVIKMWVDENFNCEDIAMNFLISNVTGKPPMKVTPKKKFKCPECIITGNLSADPKHMETRSECISDFAKIYGIMALKSVEYRADPVLHIDNVPEELKRFKNVGDI